MAGVGAIISAIAAVASAGVGAASASGAFGGKSSGAGAPKIPTVDTSTMSKALLPEAKANAAANLGGGISPQFLSGVIDQQTGTPGAGLGILGDITKSLGNQF
jgi:hypothetical protein